MRTSILLTTFGLTLWLTGCGGGGGSDTGGTAPSSTAQSSSSLSLSSSSVSSSAAASSVSSASSVVSSASSHSVVSSSASSSNRVPADLSDVQFLSKWKITLPITTTNDSNKAAEVKQPSLATYKHDDYFHLNANGTGIIFKAIAGGARTSSGTAYPRSELREMKGNGTSNADWSCTSTSNGMNIRQRLLTTTPTEKPNATIAQIHDASNDNLMVKYFGPDTGANGTSDTGVIEARFNNDSTTVRLDSAYKLGDEMTINVSNTPAGMRVEYRNLRTNVTKDTGNVPMVGVVGSCYYKAGLYIQTCSKVDIYGRTNSVCVDKNFSEGRYAQPWDSATLEMFSLQLTNPQ